MVTACVSSRSELFENIQRDEWRLKDVPKLQVKVPAKKRKSRNTEEFKNDMSFNVEIGNNTTQELEYILLNKRQHYVEVVNSLDTCLKEAMRKSETKKALPNIVKVQT